MDVEAVEKVMGDAILQATDHVAEALHVKPFGAAVLETLQPLLHDAAEALVAAAEASDTPEQFAARMAALNAKES